MFYLLKDAMQKLFAKSVLQWRFSVVDKILNKAFIFITDLLNYGKLVKLNGPKLTLHFWRHIEISFKCKVKPWATVEEVLNK